MKYPGGKGKCFQHIINIFPPHTTYIETHLGGGAVLRNKRAARQSIGIDKDKQVISFWRNNYPDLAEYVHADAVEFLRSYPFKGSELIYCDPPYLSSTRKRSRVYRHDLTEADHGALLDALVQIPCLVAISGYTSTLYQSRLRGWHSISFLPKHTTAYARNGFGLTTVFQKSYTICSTSARTIANARTSKGGWNDCVEGLGGSPGQNNTNLSDGCPSNSDKER